MSLSRDQLLAFKPTLSGPINVPGLGGTVRLRMLDGLTRERFEQARVADGRTNIRASLLAFTIADDDGKLVFSEADIPAINAMPSPALIPLYDAAIEMNKIDAEQVEELAGN